MKPKFIFFRLFVVTLFASGCDVSHGKNITIATLFNHDYQVNNIYVDKSVKDFPYINETSDSSFQLITHGRPGELLINGEWKNAPQIAFFLRSRLPGFGSRVNHINIYGCKFGKGKAGARAVAYLQGTLGISVAASDDITGKDGDWELEVGTPASVLSFPRYNRNLQTCSPDYGTYVSATAYAATSSGGYSGAANGAGNPDGSGISVYYNAAPGDTYQGIFSYTNTFSGGDTLKITARYNDNRHDGVTFEFSQDGITYTAPSPAINGFASNNTYSMVQYTIPVSLTGQYKYIRIRGITTNSFLNIDAIQAVIVDCYNCNISISPTLSATTISNVCPVATYNLNSITASNTPAGAELTWHTGTPATNANRISNTAAASGTGGRFYAAFYSTANGCYSGVSGAATTMVLTNPDTDCDGVVNSADIDDDNDGVLDLIEMQNDCSSQLIMPASATATPVYSGAVNTINATGLTGPDLNATHNITTPGNAVYCGDGYYNITMDFAMPAASKVRKVVLWAPEADDGTSGGEGPIKEFTVTVTYNGGLTYTSGVFTTVKPTGIGTPAYAQVFDLGNLFINVTNIRFNISDGWYDSDGLKNDNWTSAKLEPALPGQYNLTLGEFRAMCESYILKFIKTTK